MCSGMLLCAPWERNFAGSPITVEKNIDATLQKTMHFASIFYYPYHISGPHSFLSFLVCVQPSMGEPWVLSFKYCSNSVSNAVGFCCNLPAPHKYNKGTNFNGKNQLSFYVQSAGHVKFNPILFRNIQMWGLQIDMYGQTVDREKISSYSCKLRSL